MNALLAADGGLLLTIQNSIRTPWLNGPVEAITHLGDHGYLWVALTLVLLIIPKTRRIGLASLLSLVICYVTGNLILKNLIARTRPYEVVEGLKLLVKPEPSFSFPSGHASNGFASAWAIYRTVGKKRWGALALVAAGLIALTRLYVGVHYPTDVVAGVILGILAAQAGVWLLGVIERKRAAR